MSDNISTSCPILTYYNLYRYWRFHRLTHILDPAAAPLHDLQLFLDRQAAHDFRRLFALVHLLSALLIVRCFLTSLFYCLGSFNSLPHSLRCVCV